MKYLVRKSFVRVLGRLWMPRCVAATQLNLCASDIDNMRGPAARITREAVEQWVSSHSGDFSQVLDFSASIEDGDNTVEFSWSSEDNEVSFYECMNSAED